MRTVMSVIVCLVFLGVRSFAGTVTNMGQSPDWQGSNLVFNTDAATARTMTRTSSEKHIRGQVFQARQGFVWSGLTLKMKRYKDPALSGRLQIKLYDMVDDTQDGVPDNNNQPIATNSFDISALATGGSEELSDGDWIHFDFDVKPSITGGTRCGFLLYWEGIDDNNGVYIYLNEGGDPVSNCMYRGDTTYTDSKWDETLTSWQGLSTDSTYDLGFAVTTETPIQQIAWDPVSNTTNLTDVFAEPGWRVHVAVNAGGNTPQTVNGITFDAGGTSPLGAASSGFLSGTVAGYSAGDPIWDMLNTVSYGGGDGWTAIDITGLNVGREYMVQVFYVDQRASSTRMFFPDSASGGATLQGGTSIGDAMGQNAVGYFTATASTQKIYLQPLDVGNSHINAYQVQEKLLKGTVIFMR